MECAVGVGVDFQDLRIDVAILGAGIDLIGKSRVEGRISRMSVNVMGIFVRGYEMQLHSNDGRVKSTLSLRCVKLQAEEVCYFRRLSHRQADLPDPVNERDSDPNEGIVAFGKCQNIGIV